MSHFLTQLNTEPLKKLRDYLQPVQFQKGQCLITAGDAGDGCYLIDEGEVRVELHRRETDSEHVLCHLGPGSVIGEFSLLDGEPRSANVYAETNVAARWLSRADFESACLEQPAVGVAVLTALSRDLSAKLRQQNNQMADHMFASDPDLETRETVATSVSAQKEFANWTEDRVDALLLDVAETVAQQAEGLADVNVTDTGIGVVADKILKIRFACREVYGTLSGRQAAGLLPEAGGRRVLNIAGPVGVVLGIIPVTNPVSTIIFKTLICLKGRNALILSCHRDALRVGNMTGELIQSALKRHGAPVGLVQWIKNRTDRRKTAMLMRHPDVSFILATGGPSIVSAAYSSGTPAIGVGAGNAPVLICADADLRAAAEQVVRGKSFDNGIICGSENNLVVVQSVRDEFIQQLEAAGARVLSPDEKHRLTASIFNPEDCHMKREITGKSAAQIAAHAGIYPDTPPRLLVVPVKLDELAGPYGHEKLAPILSLFTVADEAEGLNVCQRILTQQGMGHTAAIHTRNESLAKRFGLEMPASRVLVNACAAQGCIGIGTGLTPSFTLGCGTYGGNSTTDNVTYTHVLNIKRLAFAS